MDPGSALSSAVGVNMLYVGMFDEVDEGTAIFETEYARIVFQSGRRS